MIGLGLGILTGVFVMHLVRPVVRRWLRRRGGANGLDVVISVVLLGLALRRGDLSSVGFWSTVLAYEVAERAATRTPRAEQPARERL